MLAELTWSFKRCPPHATLAANHGRRGVGADRGHHWGGDNVAGLVGGLTFAPIPPLSARRLAPNAQPVRHRGCRLGRRASRDSDCILGVSTGRRLAGPVRRRRSARFITGRIEEGRRILACKGKKRKRISESARPEGLENLKTRTLFRFAAQGDKLPIIPSRESRDLFCAAETRLVGCRKSGQPRLKMS